jgi:iron complex transport system permease protein
VGTAGVGWPRDGRLLEAAWSLLAGAWGPREPLSTTLGIRLTAVLLACIAGTALASGGVALQALLRNPLGEPYILGLSSGAALGVMVRIALLHERAQTYGTTYLWALAGAAITAGIVFLAARRRGAIDILGLLLTGVVLSVLCAATTRMLEYLYGRGHPDEALARWQMGHLDDGLRGQFSLTLALGVVVGGVGVLMAYGRAMDVATFSDTEAQSLGVNLPRLRTVLFIVASVLATAAVVVAGPLAFVGLICPHVARLALGPSHRPLVIGASLLGAALVVLADTAASAIGYVWNIGTLPIGIFTALLGGPVFLWMLRPQLGRGGEV